MADMVKVEVPSMIAAGIRRRGIPPERKRPCAIGAMTNMATNRLTPPNVTIAPPRTTARIARWAPSFRVMKLAIAATEPQSSISLPNSAPSRKSGKNWARKPAALRMNVCVQCARIGSCEKNAATTAAIGASRRTLQPLNASQIRRPSPTRIPARPTRSGRLISALRQQFVEVDRGPFADVLAMRRQELVGAAPPLLLQQRAGTPLPH